MKKSIGSAHFCSMIDWCLEHPQTIPAMLYHYVGMRLPIVNYSELISLLESLLEPMLDYIQDYRIHGARGYPLLFMCFLFLLLEGVQGYKVVPSNYRLIANPIQQSRRPSESTSTPQRSRLGSPP